MKTKLIYGVVLLLLLNLACQDHPENTFERMQGNTMGTTYHITYEKAPTDSKIYTYEVDSVLQFINQIASTYIPSSIISRLNQGKTISTDTLDEKAITFFRDNIEISQKVWEWSEGYFDPTVMPLINYWGFGYEGHRPVSEVDSMKVDSLTGLVGFSRIKDRFDSNTWVLPENMQLDFSAVAKGAACDFLGQYFEERGIFNYLVEIGGETLAMGLGRSGKGWIIGINRPQKNAPTVDLVEELAILNQAVATSGNYQNYYETNGETYGHTINPLTGYPEDRGILSATVIADQCGMADALATAFMAMGAEKSKNLLPKLSGIEAYLIYTNASDSLLIYETEGIKKLKHNTQ